MNLKTKFLLKKIAACLCLIIAMSLFFTGWISVRQNDFTRELKSELRELDDELEMMEEECEELQEELEDLADEMDEELNISVEDIYKSVEKLYNMIEDLALSPKEIIGVLPMISKLANIIEEFEDSDLPYYMLPMSGFEDFVETMEEIKGVLIALTVLFVAALALDIMYIVFHILNKKGAGFGAIPLHVIWLLIGGFPVLVSNMAMMEEYNTKVLSLSPAPYIALALVIASCIIWRYAMKDLTILNIQGDKADPLVDMDALKGKASELKDKTSGLKDKMSDIGGKMSDMTGKIMNQTSVGTVSCPSCGKECAKGSLFCAGCGSKLEQPEAKVFCMNCGQQISATATFCNQCGAKVEK